MPQIRITQERSQIRCLKKHKRTLVALGLRRLNHSVVHEDTPQIRGMAAQVDYLVRVEPVVEAIAGDGAGAEGAEPAPVKRKRVAARPKRAAAKPKRATAGRKRAATGKAKR